MDSDQPSGETLIVNSPGTVLGSDPSISMPQVPITSGVLEQTSSTQSTDLPVEQPQVVDLQVQQPSDKLRLFHFNKSAMLASVAALMLIASVGVGSLLLTSSNKGNNNSVTGGGQKVSESYKPQNLEIGNVAGYNKLLTGRSQNLTVNGQLSVANSLILSPTSTPTTPTLGQLYYNSGNNTPYFYNGKNFISLVPAAGGTISGTSQSLVLGGGLSLQGSNLVNSGVTSLSGTANEISVSASNGNVQLSLPSDLKVGNLTANSLSGNGSGITNISQSALPAGIAYLNQSNTFTGSLQFFANSTNSSNAFSIQDASGNTLLNANTANDSLSVSNLLPTSTGQLLPGSYKNSIITPADQNGNQNYNEKWSVIGPNGYVDFVYADDDSNGNKYADLHLVQCTNSTCTTNTNTVIASNSQGIYMPTITIGSDGFARIAYESTLAESNGYFNGFNAAGGSQIDYLVCQNTACSSSTTSVIDNISDPTSESFDNISMIMGSDGFARIVYDQFGGYTNGDISYLKLARCLNTDCTSVTSTTLDSQTSNTEYYNGAYVGNSIVFGSDGYPRIAYGYDAPNYSTTGLRYIDCTNADCSGDNPVTLDSGNSQYSDFLSIGIGIGGDGNPEIVSNVRNDLLLYHCSTASCSSVSTTILNTLVYGGGSISMAIGTDGFPRVDFSGNSSYRNLYYIDCSNLNCSGDTPITLDSNQNAGNFSSLTLNSNNYISVVYGSSPIDFFAQTNVNDQPMAVGTDIGSSSQPFGTLYVSQIVTPNLKGSTNSLLVQGSVNSTNTFEVQNATSVPLFNIDTINNLISMYGATSIQGALNINSTSSSSESNTNSTPTTDFTSSAWKAIGRDEAFSTTNGNYSYVIHDDDSSLQIYNVSSPSSPSLVSTTPTGLSGSTSSSLQDQVEVSGNYAYVTVNEYITTSQTYDSYLLIYNVSNPASPSLVSTTSLYSNAGSNNTESYESGSYMYFYVNNSQDMLIYNVSSPSSPSLVSTTKVGSCGNETGGITVYSTYAYISSCGSLYVYNITTPATPSQSNSTALPYSSYYTYNALLAYNGYLYVSGNTMLVIYSLSTPNTPVQESSTYVSGSSSSGYGYLGISGNYLFISLAYAYLSVYNISNPSSPVNVSNGANNGYYIAPAVSNNYAITGLSLSGNDIFVSGTDGSVMAYDVSTPTTAPSLLGSIESANTGWNLSSGQAQCISSYCDFLYTGQFTAVAGDSYEVNATLGNGSCFNVSIGNSYADKQEYCNGEQYAVLHTWNGENGLYIFATGTGNTISNVQVFQITSASPSLDLQQNGSNPVEIRSSAGIFIGQDSGAIAYNGGGIGLGDYTLSRLSTGYDDVALGRDTLSNDTSGSNNTAVGTYSMVSNYTGSMDTAVGSASDVANGLQNATAVGANANAQESNSFIIGSGVDAGIGTTTPSSALNIVDQGGSTDSFIQNSSSTATNSGGSDNPGLSANWYNATSGNYQTPGSGTLAYSGTDGPIDWPDIINNRPSGVNSTYINAQWTGYLYAPYSGSYSICTTSDDGSRIYLSGTQILNNWYSQAATERCRQIHLTAGVWYPITIQYFQGNGAATMDLSWSEPSIAGGNSEDIPAADLSTTEPNGNIYTAGFIISPTVTVQGNTISNDPSYGLQQDVIGVEGNTGGIVAGLTSNGALQGSNGAGTDTSGGNIVVAGGQGTGSANGGSINLQIAPAGSSGTNTNSLLTVVNISGVNGAATFENAINSTSAFEVQNSTGTNIFGVDAADGNGRVGIGMASNTPGNLLSIGALTTAAGTYQIAVTTGGTTNSGIVVQDVASQTSGYAFTLQSSTGTSLASIDYQGNLSVKNATITGGLTLDGHVITGNSSGTTTAAAQTNLGTSGTCSLAPANYGTSNDTSGMIILTPAGSGIANDKQCVITFSSAYGYYPHIIISPINAASASLGAYASASSNSTFYIGVTTAGTSGTTYMFNYFVAQ